MLNKLYLFLMFLLSFTFCRAQETYQEVVTDSAYSANFKDAKIIDSALIEGYVTNNNLTPKKFKPNFRKNYQTDEFNYTPKKPKTTGWDNLMRKIGELLRDIFGGVDGKQTVSFAGIFFKILGFFLLGFILYIIISYFVSKEGNFIFRKKNKTVNINSEDIVENIHEINFSEKILEFEKEKDFRTAIRYQFLNVLKKLSDKKMIDWNTEKTNHDYEREIKQEKIKEMFSELLYIFEYVWYGEFEINEENYQQLKKKFETVFFK